MVEVKTLFMEFLKTLTKGRVQKAEQSNESLNLEEVVLDTPNLNKHLEGRMKEPVQYGGILHRVETTTKNNTAVKDTDSGPQ